jgi:transcriptional regulator with XRE-family HTH domain
MHAISRHHSKYATEADAAYGAAFRKRREEAGFSIKQVAERCGAHQSTLARLERGEFPWHEDHRADFNEALDELIAHGKPAYVTRAQIEEIARLRRQGMGPHRISHIVGMKWQRIRRIIDENRYPEWTGGSIRYINGGEA